MVRGGASYIDAVNHWCASRGLEPEAGADLVLNFPEIRERLQLEAENLSLLKRDDF